MALTDSRDLAVTTQNARSVELYETALRLLNGYYGDPLGVIDAALDADPGFAMGHALRAGLMLTAGDGTAEPMLRDSVEAGEALGGLNEREQRHLAAARAWLDGEFERSLRLYGDIVVDYPRDLLAIQVAHLGDFLLGQSSMLRDRISQVLPHWDEGMPGYGYLLGMHAFGLEETQLYGRAEESGRRALELNPRDPWAVHAVAHVMEMQGRLDDGIAWLNARRDDWSEDNMLAVHNWWHLALFQLEAGNTDDVLALYDHEISRPAPAIALDLVDASALLWRLRLRGVDVGTRWQPVADDWLGRGAAGYYAFNDVHAVMASLGAHRPAAVDQLRAALERAALGNGTNAMMARDVGLPVADALIAFEQGDYTGAIDLLLPVRLIAHRFGGSHAQRDVIGLTLLESALRAGRRNLAIALTAERAALRPVSPSLHRLVQRADSCRP
ncbi:MULTISPECIES: tetratricopeptide repeat protein [Cupriavidus]|uniref:Tetratricopeptide repeat protein 38 n=1 Tax=Cupriavidus oxalaticus TaxID=96344 RepID=A0A4P7LF52_9BURK|nr:MULTISPECIES: tetratricopeptide repeat protein [Cupriavidus]MBF6990188.1 tetratricopeptide repeat protein [Cupriavidus sp. IK-TO18]QBY50461.1 tetratricopeptide repeat protein [Cupriavidus oxalaticus]TDF64113.1 tetratricopeptide repeat protein [Cupriavidus sp. L7L]